MVRFLSCFLVAMVAILADYNAQGEIHSLSVNQHGFVPPGFMLELSLNDTSTTLYIEIYYDGKFTGTTMGVKLEPASDSRRKRGLEKTDELGLVHADWTTADNGVFVILKVVMEEKYNGKVFGIKNRDSNKFLNYTMLVQKCPKITGMNCPTNYKSEDNATSCEFGTYLCVTECTACIDGYYTLSQETLDAKTCQANAQWNDDVTLCNLECDVVPDSLNLKIFDIVKISEGCDEGNYNRPGCIVTFECSSEKLFNNTCLVSAVPYWKDEFDCSGSREQYGGFLALMTSLSFLLFQYVL